jgi:hypothetical protein
MKLKNLNKALVSGVVAVTATTGLIASTMVAANADPTRPYAAVGSDTIQDVWNALTNDFGAVEPSIASWNAFVFPSVPAGTTVPPAYIQTKTGGAWFLRPSGSGAGVTALSDTWDPAVPTHVNTQVAPIASAFLNHEDVDFARSSSGPGTGSGLTYMPFARDAVTFAFIPTTGLTSLSLTEGQLHEIYSGVDDTSDGVVTFTGPTNPATVATHVFVNGVEVHPKLPQSASGTRKFFAGAIAVSNTAGANAPYVSDVGTTAQGGLPENDGAALVNPGDLIPFSAAQWIAQNNGAATNTTTGDTLGSITIGTTVTAATSGTAPTLVPGPLFGAANLSGNFTTPPTGGVGSFNRDTYDVVPTSFLTGTSKQQALVSILGGGIGGAGGSSVISTFGFGTLQYIGDSTKFKSGVWVP